MVLKQGERNEIRQVARGTATNIRAEAMERATHFTTPLQASVAALSATDAALSAADTALDARVDTNESDINDLIAADIAIDLRLDALEAGGGGLLTFRGACARMTSNDTTVNATANYTISFDATLFDTDSFWSAGTPTRLTIPASLGIVYVELNGQICISSGTSDTNRSAFIVHFNSSNVQQRIFGVFNNEGGAVNWVGNPRTGPVAVADGDYFTLVFNQETDTSVTVEGTNAFDTSLSIRIIGMV